MANPTYSIGATGLLAQSVTTTKLYDIPDTGLNGNMCAKDGGMQQTMAIGDQMLIKGPDGALFWAKYDSERSTPANPILLRV